MRTPIAVVALCLSVAAPCAALAQTTASEGPSLAITARDLARGPASAPRSVALLRSEETLLERLVSSTPDGDATLGRLCERLIRLRSELARALRSESPADEPQWVQRALEASTRLSQIDPTLAADERNALLHASLVAEASGMTAARPLLQALLLAHPASTTAPIVYAIFGDHFMAHGDPLVAQRFYERAMSGVRTQTFLYGYCQYRLAWLDAARREDRDSLLRFTTALESARSMGTSDGATELAAAARRDLVAPYSRIGRRDRAELFFRRFATLEQTREMLSRLDTLLRQNRRR